jgi:hypothetical protein
MLSHSKPLLSQEGVNINLWYCCFNPKLTNFFGKYVSLSYLILFSSFFLSVLSADSFLYE